MENKSYSNCPLSRVAILFTKLVNNPRWGVERIFSSIKSLFGSGKIRYKGLARVHAQHLMDAIEHNSYRTLGIIMRCL
ncbi:MAG: transposase [Flavobacteriales bacterium Tduv]